MELVVKNYLFLTIKNSLKNHHHLIICAYFVLSLHVCFLLKYLMLVCQFLCTVRNTHVFRRSCDAYQGIFVWPAHEYFCTCLQYELMCISTILINKTIFL